MNKELKETLLRVIDQGFLDELCSIDNRSLINSAYLAVFSGSIPLF